MERVVQTGRFISRFPLGKTWETRLLRLCGERINLTPSLSHIRRQMLRREEGRGSIRKRKKRTGHVDKVALSKRRRRGRL